MIGTSKLNIFLFFSDALRACRICYSSARFASSSTSSTSFGSQAGGEHLCFLGSDRQEEDRYTHGSNILFTKTYTICKHGYFWILG